MRGPEDETPYGTWHSPVSAALLGEGAVRLDYVRTDGEDVYWVEGRASEGGRQVVVRHGHGDVAAPARSTVYEYGGMPYAPRDGRVLFCRHEDQALVWSDGEEVASGAKYADPQLAGDRVLCIRERGDTHDVVAISPSGTEVVAEGRDFYLHQRAHGDRVAWLCWDHPNMSWDNAELWVDGRHVAGGDGVAISQPEFSPDGVLHYLSDRTGFWNLYREDHDGPLVAADLDFAGPDWTPGGQSSYAFLADGTLVTTWIEQGRDRIGVVRDGRVDPLDLPYTAIFHVQPCGDGVACIAASPRHPAAVVRIAVPTGEVEVLRPGREIPFDSAYISEPRFITFETGGGHEVAHAWFYPPANPDFRAPEGEKPPLLVILHGGPTGRTSTELRLPIQYWTSRGIGVADVEYRGSGGFGRAYRDALRGRWGVADVEDCVAAARFLAGQGEADPDRLLIRGGSAGGFTVLQALTTTDLFAAGSNLYGVSDPVVIATDTHKLEARYLDGLIGPYPEAAHVYRERSPIHHLDRLSCPVITFQGLDDKVVPPAQSEMLVEALRARGIPHEYLTFEGEGHGFRRAETIQRVAEAELAFFGRVLGFTPR